MDLEAEKTKEPVVNHVVNHAEAIEKVALQVVDPNVRPVVIALVGDTVWKPFFKRLRAELQNRDLVVMAPAVYPEHPDTPLTPELIVESSSMYMATVAASADVIVVINPGDRLSEHVAEFLTAMEKDLQKTVLFDNRNKLTEFPEWIHYNGLY